MSAILPTSNLPTLINLEDIKTYIESTVQNTIENRIVPIIESVVRRVLAEQTPIENVVETVLATSELKVLKRISTVETVLGLNDFADEEQQTIPVQINLLADRIDNLSQNTVKATESTEDELDERDTYLPSSKIGKAAIELIKFASTRPIVDGSKTITNSVLHQFRKHILPEELRPKESYARQWKRELTDIVSELAPVRKDKKGNNRGVRLVFPKNFDVGMTKCKLNVS
jgi:hypothetical protein